MRIKHIMRMNASKTSNRHCWCMGHRDPLHCHHRLGCALVQMLSIHISCSFRGRFNQFSAEANIHVICWRFFSHFRSGKNKNRPDLFARNPGENLEKKRPGHRAIFVSGTCCAGSSLFTICGAMNTHCSSMKQQQQHQQQPG